MGCYEVIDDLSEIVLNCSFLTNYVLSGSSEVVNDFDYFVLNLRTYFMLQLN